MRIVSTSLFEALVVLAIFSSNELKGEFVVWTVEDGGNGHAYSGVTGPDGSVTWFEANEAATAAGGHLATITSQTENEFVFSLINNPVFWNTEMGSIQNGPWLGGIQPPGSPEPRGNWQWVTGESFEFTSWDRGEPNERQRDADHLHYFSLFSPDFLPFWNDTPATNGFVKAYVIEIPDPSNLPTLIGDGEQWSFHPGTNEPSPFPELEWTTTGFDDTTWDSGPEGFGYGPDTDTRKVANVVDGMKDNYTTYYVRHRFEVENPEVVSELLLQMDYDDAFIAYINGIEVTRSNNIGTPGTPEPFAASVQRGRRGSGVTNFLIELDAFPELLQAGENNMLAIQGINQRSSDRDFVLSQISLLGLVTEMVSLQAGDADQDFDFDQLDLVQVQIGAKYLTGQAATWGEGDWDGAPGGSPGSPPAGDGLFNQFDVIAAQQGAAYLTGPYAAVQTNGQLSDGQTSIIYNAGTGEVSVDAPVGVELTSINIDSAAGIFTAQAAANLGGSFDNDADGNIFKATFGSSFASLSFGNVAQTGLSEEFVLGDLTVIGSLAGGGDLGNVDLVYVPEPASALLLAIGLVIGLTRIRRGKH